MPRIYMTPQDAPNAFATGRNPSHAVVAVTQGILRLCNEQELSGVLAHEMSHVKHRDMLISTIAATVAGAISSLAYIAQWGLIFGGMGGGRNDDRRGGNAIGLLLMIIVAPIAAALIQLGDQPKPRIRGGRRRRQVCAATRCGWPALQSSKATTARSRWTSIRRSHTCSSSSRSPAAA